MKNNLNWQTQLCYCLVSESYAVVLLCSIMSVVFSCLGLVESAGSLEWELLSVADNKERGSQERLIEKLHYIVDHKQQSTSESEKIHIVCNNQNVFIQKNGFQLLCKGNLSVRGRGPE